MLLNVTRAKSIMDADGVDAVVASNGREQLLSDRVSGRWARRCSSRTRSSITSIAPAAAPEAGALRLLDQVKRYDPARHHDHPGAHVDFGTFFRDSVAGVELDVDEQRILDITQAHQTGRSSVDAPVEAITATLI